MRFHGHQVDDPAESLLASNGHLQRHHRAPKCFLQRFHRPFKAGEFAVHPGKHKGPGDIVFGAVIPHFFRGDLRAGMRVDGDERGIGGDQRSFRFGNECGIAGEVEKIDFDGVAATERAGPFRIRQPRLNGDLPRDLFFIPIGGGAALRNFAETRRRPGGKQ